MEMAAMGKEVSKGSRELKKGRYHKGVFWGRSPGIKARRQRPGTTCFNPNVAVISQGARDLRHLTAPRSAR